MGMTPADRFSRVRPGEGQVCRSHFLRYRGECLMKPYIFRPSDSMRQASKGVQRTKKFSVYGFTLAELLVVVAMISVMVAIGVPVFGNHLERSRQALDADTLRQAYDIATIAQLEQELADGNPLTTGKTVTGKDSKTFRYFWYNPANGTLGTTQIKCGQAHGPNVLIDLSDSIFSTSGGAIYYANDTLSGGTTDKGILVAFAKESEKYVVKVVAYAASETFLNDK